MKLTYRFDESNEQHAKVTLFINGANTGALTMSPAEAIWLHHILHAGCAELSPPGRKRIEFAVIGHDPDITLKEIEMAVK